MLCRIFSPYLSGLKFYATSQTFVNEAEIPSFAVSSVFLVYYTLEEESKYITVRLLVFVMTKVGFRSWKNYCISTCPQTSVTRFLQKTLIGVSLIVINVCTAILDMLHTLVFPQNMNFVQFFSVNTKFTHYVY